MIFFIIRAAKDVQNQIKDGIANVNVTNELINDYFEKIRYLGRLLDFDIEGYEQFLSFQEELEILDQDPDIGMWNVQSTFDSLAPSCNELLLLCRFNNIEKACTEYFVPRRTAFGTCCVFNFARPTGATV